MKAYVVRQDSATGYYRVWNCCFEEWVQEGLFEFEGDARRACDKLNKQAE